MQLTFNRSHHAGTTTLFLAGEVDLNNVDDLISQLTATIAGGAHDLVVDLDGVSYLDSAGLGALVGAHKRLVAAGGVLTIRCSRQRVLRLFELTGLSRVLRMHDSSLDVPAAVSA